MGAESLAEVKRGRKRLPREMADDECDRQTDEEDMEIMSQTGLVLLGDLEDR
jgi:hypothetical protein